MNIFLHFCIEGRGKDMMIKNDISRKPMSSVFIDTVTPSYSYEPVGFSQISFLLFFFCDSYKRIFMDKVFRLEIIIKKKKYRQIWVEEIKCYYQYCWKWCNSMLFICFCHFTLCVIFLVIVEDLKSAAASFYSNVFYAAYWEKCNKFNL